MRSFGERVPIIGPYLRNKEGVPQVTVLLATFEDFHAPWRFNINISALDSTSNGAEDLRKHCPVYCIELLRFKYLTKSIG